MHSQVVDLILSDGKCHKQCDASLSQSIYSRLLGIWWSHRPSLYQGFPWYYLPWVSLDPTEPLLSVCPISFPLFLKSDLFSYFLSILLFSLSLNDLKRLTYNSSQQHLHFEKVICGQDYHDQKRWFSSIENFRHQDKQIKQSISTSEYDVWMYLCLHVWGGDSLRKRLSWFCSNTPHKLMSCNLFHDCSPKDNFFLNCPFS